MVEGNTRQFLAGLPANNALLWGTRGTGKSSLVRALLHRYAAEGLRIIQVDKDDLVEPPRHRRRPSRRSPTGSSSSRDDLSFETGEPSYKMLKSALDGSVYALPENVLIYVTSNRRHLLPEYESDNRGAMMVNGEIHHGEAVEEKISLSGRFGLWVAFHAFSQDQYLEVVRQWVDRLAERAGVHAPWSADAEAAAILWSQRKGDRERPHRLAVRLRLGGAGGAGAARDLTYGDRMSTATTPSGDLRRFAFLSIAAAVVTIGMKAVAWRLTGSVGLLSDALESLVNLAAAVITW